MKAIPVLMYHHVSPAPGLVTVSPELFRAQMQLLARVGYRTLSAAEFDRYLSGTLSIAEKSIVITFDDGYLDNYIHAFPVLKEFGLHAIIFAITAWIGDGPARALASAETGALKCLNHKECKAAIATGDADAAMLRWSEIKIMAATGLIEVHSHTHSHIRWDKTHESSDKCLAALKADLEQSQRTLQEQLGHHSTHLCWPWGYYEASYLGIALDAGFRTLYTVEKGVVTRHVDRLRVPRIGIKDKTLAWFARRIWIYSNSLTAALYMRLRKD